MNKKWLPIRLDNVFWSNRSQNIWLIFHHSNYFLVLNHKSSGILTPNILVLLQFKRSSKTWSQLIQFFFLCNRTSNSDRESHEVCFSFIIQTFKKQETWDPWGFGLCLAWEEPGEDSQEHPGVDQSHERSSHEENLLEVSSVIQDQIHLQPMR